MADDLSLVDMPVESTGKLRFKITADDGTSMSIDFITSGGDVLGSADLTKATGAGTIQLAVDIADTQVEAVAIALSVNDIVRNQDTGEVVVVQAVRLGPNADLFSTATSGQPSYAAEGWVVVGSATLT